MPGPFAKFFRPEDAWLEDYLNADKSSEVAAQNQEPWAAPLRAPAQMPPVQYGTTTKDAQEELDKKTTGRKGVTLPQGEEDLTAHGRLLQFIRQQPEIQEQQQGQAALRDLLRTEAGQAPMLDLGPLYDLANTWTGSKMGAGYMRPESAAARRDKILGYAEKLQDNQRDLATSVSTMLGRMIPTLPVETQQLVEALKNALSKTVAPIKGTGPKDFSKDLQKFQKVVAPHTRILIEFERANEALRAAGINIDTWTGKNIPGAGLTGKAPYALLHKLEGKKGALVKQRLKKLRATLHNVQTGQQSSEAEYRRIADMLGESWFSTDAETIEAMHATRSAVQGQLSQAEAGFAPEVLQLYRSRKGRLSDDPVLQMTDPKEPTFDEYRKLSPEEKKKARGE